MADYYVSASSGNDANSGTGGMGNAKEHISAIIDILPTPIDEETIIHLDGSVTTPQDYDESGDLELSDIRPVGKDGILIIQPEIWNNDNYEDNADPFDATAGAGTFDPKATKPCTLKFNITLTNSSDIVFRGVEILAPSVPGIVFGTSLKAERYSDADLDYCSISGGLVGVNANLMSTVLVNNCYVDGSTYGVLSSYKSMLGLQGQNHIENAVDVGVFAYIQSTISIRAWNQNPEFQYATTINTTKPRANYSAIMGMGASAVICEDFQFFAGQRVAPLVLILNETSGRSHSYYGVNLDTASLFSGADSVTFRKEGYNQDRPTVPPSRQYVSAAREGTVITR